VEIVFPAHAYIGECLGVCSVPTGVSVEEALRLLREIGAIRGPVESVHSLKVVSFRQSNRSNGENRGNWGRKPGRQVNSRNQIKKAAAVFDQLAQKP
jgi:hypothetical protein